MLAIIKKSGRLFLFLLLLFNAGRYCFLFYNYKDTFSKSISESLLSSWYGLPLDISTACYLMILPILLLTINAIVSSRLLMIILKIYFIIVIILVSAIYASELLIYQEWNSKLHYKAIMHLENPSEAFNSATGTHTFRFFLFFTLLIASGAFLYLRKIHVRLQPVITPLWKRILFPVLFFISSSFLLVIGMRGGFQPIAINQSETYYSKNNILNDAAVNSSWNLLHSFIENSSNLETNPYNYYDLASCHQKLDSLFTPEKDTTICFLKTKRPNIVLFILESWSADLIKPLGGDTGITPKFEKLCSEGLLFTRCYATGKASDQGIPGVLSGFPAQPNTSIITQPSKYRKMTCCNTEFKNHGYQTSFYFGGQLIYGNIKSYIYYNGFDRIMEEKDFHDKSFIHGRLGVHDEFLFRYQQKDMDQEKQPFFSTMFTLSTHSPFDMPMEQVLSFGGDEIKYINAAYYTDRCIGEYMSLAKTKAWYDNTLFIFIADHSHNTPRQRPFYEPDQAKIPLLMCGGALKEEFRGKQINRIMSQTDLVVTLFKQLDFNAEPFQWSKNIMNPYQKEFAFYAPMGGMGWIDPNGVYVKHTQYEQPYLENAKDSATQKQIERTCKSYLQALFQTYLDY